MDSDSGIEFDQMLSAALKILGTWVIGKIAFQLHKRIYNGNSVSTRRDIVQWWIYENSMSCIYFTEHRFPEIKGDTESWYFRKEYCYRKRHDIIRFFPLISNKKNSCSLFIFSCVLIETWQARMGVRENRQMAIKGHSISKYYLGLKKTLSSFSICKLYMYRSDSPPKSVLSSSIPRCTI